MLLDSEETQQKQRRNTIAELQFRISNLQQHPGNRRHISQPNRHTRLHMEPILPDDSQNIRWAKLDEVSKILDDNMFLNVDKVAVMQYLKDLT